MKGVKKEKAKQERIEKEQKRKQKAEKEKKVYERGMKINFIYKLFILLSHSKNNVLYFLVHYENLGGFVDSGSDEDEDYTTDEAGSQRSHIAPISKINIFTPRLIGALDKCAVTNRNAIHILSATIDALGLSVENYILNRDKLPVILCKISR